MRLAQPKARPAADLFTFEELVELYERDNPSEQLQMKLQKLLTTPFVNNEAAANGARPLKPNSNVVGRYLRIAHWNIERGLEYEALETVFTDPLKLVSLLDQTKYPPDSSRRAMVLEQLALLSQADIIVLTFEVERTLGFIGKFKLDWIFVKPPALTSPYGEGQPYAFAPHFGRTLKELNESIEDRISDHDPLIVDLPLGEPAR